jgi:hypothetical protein
VTRRCRPRRPSRGRRRRRRPPRPPDQPRREPSTQPGRGLACCAWQDGAQPP